MRMIKHANSKLRCLTLEDRIKVRLKWKWEMNIRPGTERLKNVQFIYWNDIARLSVRLFAVKKLIELLP